MRKVYFFLFFLSPNIWAAAGGSGTWGASGADPAETLTTFSVTADPIAEGVVLRFRLPEDIASKTEHFLILRSTGRPSHDGVFAGTDTALRLRYYHDWYKDYFYSSDNGKVFYYTVYALDQEDHMMARGQPAWLSWAVRPPPPPGTVLTPSAYRKVPLSYDNPYSPSRRLLPINIDITTIYYIGRLYSFNRLTELTNRRRSLFTRIGTWFIQMEGKVILEQEGRYLPQLAIGAEGSYMLKDTRAPSVADPTFTFNFQKETSRVFRSLFFVVSKDFGFITPGIGWVQGDSPAKLIYLTEFLAKESESDRGYFVNMLLPLTRKFALRWEIIKPLQSIGSPWLLNLQIGSFLRTNFDLAYLRYNRGYDILAHFNFRYTLYPQVKKKTK